MAGKGLTDAMVRALAPPASGRLDIPDPACRGLYLRISSTGARSWSLKYKDRLTGKTERKTLGRYPEISLARARALAEADRVAIYAGQSPQEQLRKARRAERSAPTFNELADRYLREWSSVQKKPSTVDYERASLSAARAVWGERKARTISRQEVRDFLDRRAQTAPVGANRTLAVLSGLFAWAVEKGLVDATPIQKIARPTKRERPKDRVLSEAEIRLLWPLFDQLEPAMAAAFRVLLITGQRPGQVTSMEVAEIASTTLGTIWQIPASKRKDTRGTKRGPHLLPLPGPAIEVIQHCLAAQSSPSRFVFASARNPGSPVDRHSLSRAVQRLIDRLPANASEDALRLREDRPTPHDFRRTVATQMAALGIPREDRLAVLDHSEGDVHDVHYDRHDRLREKKLALEMWAARLTEILDASTGPSRGGQKGDDILHA